MKVIDIYNKIANGEEVPTFTINDDRHKYFMKGAYLYQQKHDEEPEIVEWCMYQTWLNYDITIIEEPILTDKEYEDIEEIKIDYDDGDIALDGVYLTSNHSEILAKKINAFIKNQKHIIEEIKKLKED